MVCEYLPLHVRKFDFFVSLAFYIAFLYYSMNLLSLPAFQKLCFIPPPIIILQRCILPSSSFFSVYSVAETVIDLAWRLSWALLLLQWL